MKYVGILRQQSSNNFKSILLLVMFPALLLGLTWVFCAITVQGSPDYYDPDSYYYATPGEAFMTYAPIVAGVTAIWFLIAYACNTWMISNATNAKPLERRQNKRVYNLVENLCMAQGMAMPKINVIEDSSLNAFASGINKKNYTVTLSRGIIDRLDDAELEGVIAHELTHIRNRDVRLLIVSIIFVGIFTYIAQFAMRALWHAPRRSSKNDGGAAAAMVIVAILAAIGYLFSLLLRFAISRKREYMADAGAAEMTKNPHALAIALRRISDDPKIESVTREDVAQLFIEHPLHKKGGFSNLFATHPPIQRRIEILEQF